MNSADRKELLADWFHTAPQRRYAFAVLTVALATLANYVLVLTLGKFPPFFVFVLAVLLVSIRAGFGAGLAATILSSASVVVFSQASLSVLATSRAREVAAVIVFSGFGAGLSSLATLYRRHESRDREYERAVEGLEEMVVIVDREYRYLIANRAFLAYRGKKKEELIGRRMPEILNPGVFESEIKGRLDECFGGRPVEFEMTYQYPDRGPRELLISYLPITRRGGVDRVACVLRDITETKKADRALKLFRTLIDHSSDAVVVVDPGTGRFLDVNEKACRDFGYTREELLSLSVSDIDPTADDASRRATISELLSKDSLLKETIHRRKNGSIYPVEVSLKNVALDRNYVIAVTRDISERKKAEQALRESEDRYRDLVEHSADLVCIHDLEGRLLSVNPAPAQALGYDVDELLSMTMREMVAPEFREQFDGYLERIRSRGTDHGLLCVMSKSGERQIWEYHNTLRTDGVVKPLVRGIAHDVTERMRAEGALRSSEGRYRLLFEQNVAGVAISTLEGVLLDCNDAWARTLGYKSAGEIRGRGAKEFYFDMSDREPVRSELLRTGVAAGRELRLRRADGAPVWIVYDSVVRSEGLQTVIQATAIDITERKCAEEALRKSEEHFRYLVEQASDGIFIADAEGKYLDVNTAGAEMLGYSREEILGLSIADAVAAQEMKRIPAEIARLGRGATVRSEWMFRRKDGSLFPGEVCGKRLPDGRVQGIVRDMTERKRAEEEMRRSEERFRVALKDSPITVFNQDSELRYTWVYNPQLYWQHDILGKTDEDLLGKKGAASLTALKRRVIKSGVSAREEVATSTNGSTNVFDVSVEPLFDADGNVAGITGASVDIARLRELTDRLQDARDRLAQEKTYLEEEIKSELGFEKIIGQSPALREVLKKARIVAPTDSTVLLLGETGTGKELVARSIHGLSSRSDKTFVKLNCAAVPSGLLESELFGHEKGAFTGAISQKVGRIELAHKGTLFLDEIGEMPPELQPKLLRVLQDREFERLGGVHTLKVDVRIISATNRDLGQDVADKKFREDLFYRLNVFPIELPPLRERREDIPQLVHYFVEKHAAAMKRHIDTIPDESMQILRRWSWPGNIRELENMIERMVIMTKGRVLAAPPSELETDAEGAEENLTEIEREHLVRVLRATQGVLSGPEGAASRLGLKRTTLQSMLKRFGIEPQEFRRGDGTFGGE